MNMTHKIKLYLIFLIVSIMILQIIYMVSHKSESKKDQDGISTIGTVTDLAPQWEEQALNGDEMAIYSLATFKYTGKKKEELLIQLASQNHTQAMVDLIMAYKGGLWGIQKNCELAIYWKKKLLMVSPSALDKVYGDNSCF